MRRRIQQRFKDYSIFQPLSDRASLAICLNHPQSQLRIEALQRIRQGIQSKQVNANLKFFLFILLCVEYRTRISHRCVTFTFER